MKHAGLSVLTCHWLYLCVQNFCIFHKCTVIMLNTIHWASNQQSTFQQFCTMIDCNYQASSTMWINGRGLWRDTKLWALTWKKTNNTCTPKSCTTMYSHLFLDRSHKFLVQLTLNLKKSSKQKSSSKPRLVVIVKFDT